MVAAPHDGTRSIGGGGGGDGGGGGGGGGEETVYTVTVSGVGYRNEGYKDDGTDGIPPEPQKPPQLSSTDDDTQSRKFKLSRGEKWRIDPEEHRHRLHSVHGAVHCVPRHREPPVFHKRQRRFGYRVPVGDLRCPGAVVHLRAHLRHQEAHCQVDAMCVHAVLRSLHRLPVLS